MIINPATDSSDWDLIDNIYSFPSLFCYKTLLLSNILITFIIIRTNKIILLNFLINLFKIFLFKEVAMIDGSEGRIRMYRCAPYGRECAVSEVRVRLN